MRKTIPKNTRAPITCKQPPQLMTDFEVHEFLKQIKCTQQQQRNTPTPLATITYEMLRFLEAAPCANFKKTQVQQAIEGLTALKLPKSIIYQIINNPPKTVLEIQVIMGEKIYEVLDDDVEKAVKLCNDIFHT